MKEADTEASHMKEKPLFRRLHFFRTKSHTSTPTSLSWKISREELFKPVWQHQSQVALTRPGKLDLDANCGKYNPKLTFQIYPYGLFEDEGKAATMAVRIAIPEKCPPLPPLAQISLTLVVWGEERKDKLTLAEKLNTNVIYIYEVLTHEQLKQSKCKNFNFEIEATCSVAEKTLKI